MAGVAEGDGAEPSRLEGQMLLGGLAFATFLVTAASVIVSPFLLDLTRELTVDLAAAGNLVAYQNLTWGVSALIAGSLSDRLGRRPVLVAGLILNGISSLGVAFSPSYASIAAWRALGGVGGGAFMGTVFAAASDPFPSKRRGRALGWVMTGQSLSLLLGVPSATFLGAYVGWRGVFEVHAVGVALALVVVWLVARRGAHARASQPLPLRDAFRVLDWQSGALLFSSMAERICYSGFAVFLPTYLLAVYGVSLQALAMMLALVAVGNLVGNLAGSSLSDRTPARLLLFVASLVVTAGLGVAVFRWQPGLTVTLALGFGYALSNAFGRPALLASLSEVSSRARGAVLGLNIAFSSSGWLAATGLGGWLIDSSGFGALGGLTLAVGMTGALLTAASWLGRTVPVEAAAEASALPPVRRGHAPDD